MENSKLKCKVVMLPTTNKSKLFFKPEGNHYSYWHQEYVNDKAAHHLYFLSNREINEGDYCYSNSDKCLFKATSPDFKESCSKVEASTDPSLGLPLIPESFTLKYMGHQFKEVNIEQYASYLSGEELNSKVVIDGLIVRNDHTVIVSKVKDSWTKEEVIVLLRNIHFRPNCDIETFINTNL